MIITIELAPRDVWLLSDKAERENVTVADLIKAEAVRIARPREMLPTRIHTYWERGMCDADIAGELNIFPRQVATHRRKLGLPANKRFTKTPTRTATSNEGII